MSHLRSGFCAVSVPIGSEAAAHNTINNNITIKNEKNKDDVEEISEGIYVVYPNAADKERDIKDAEIRLEDIRKTQPDNEKLIQALSLIIEIYYSNPFYINHWLVADSNVLAKLIGILTGADRVDITLQDPTCECTCCGRNKDKTIAIIDTIYAIKNNDVKEVRYAYPEVKKVLDDSHISTKLVTLA